MFMSLECWELRFAGRENSNAKPAKPVAARKKNLLWVSPGLQPCAVRQRTVRAHSPAYPEASFIAGFRAYGPIRVIRLMDKILHYLRDPKLWELWYIPYNG